MADYDELGYWGLRLRQLGRDDAARELSDRTADRHRQGFEQAVSIRARQLLSAIPLHGVDDEERAAIEATVADIAREQVENVTDAETAELFGGRPDFTLEQFRAERHELLTRVAHNHGESGTLAKGLDYVDEADLAAELERDAYARLAAETRGKSLIELLGPLAESEAELEYRRTVRIGHLRSPIPGAPQATSVPQISDVPHAAPAMPTSELPASPRRSGQPGRPGGDGAFRSTDDADQKIGNAIRALIGKDMSPTQKAVISQLKRDGLQIELSVRGLMYWVKQIGFPDWLSYRDSRQ